MPSPFYIAQAGPGPSPNTTTQVCPHRAQPRQESREERGESPHYDHKFIFTTQIISIFSFLHVILRYYPQSFSNKQTARNVPLKIRLAKARGLQILSRVSQTNIKRAVIGVLCLGQNSKMRTFMALLLLARPLFSQLSSLCIYVGSATQEFSPKKPSHSHVNTGNSQNYNYHHNILHDFNNVRNSWETALLRLVDV